MKKILFIVCLMFSCMLHAQTKQADVTRATLYGVGFSNLLDTYLSPQEYTGIDLRLSRESVRKSRWENITQQTFFQSNLSFTHNQIENNNTIGMLANWNYALHYNFPITENFKLLAGGLTDLNGGFTYNMRNGNNPVQARIYANIGATGMAVWNTKIKNYPICLRYQINLPLMGVMFMPEYGQSYYEIFSLGQADGVINFTSLHNQPSLRQMLTADFPVGKATMRFAYMWDAQQAKVNDIKVHNYSHTFMIGFVKHFNIVK